MIGILKKDILFYLFVTLLVLPFPPLLTYEDGMTTGTVVLVVNDMLLSVLICLVKTETQEHMQSGYRFLRILPLTDRQIVGAKHLLAFLFTLINVLYGYLLLVLFPVSEQFFVLSGGCILLTANLCLLLAAGILFLIYRFGISRFTRLLPIGVGLLIGVTAVLVHVRVLRWSRQALSARDLGRLAELASGLNLTLLCCAGLGLFFLMMRASVKAKAAREE